MITRIVAIHTAMSTVELIKQQAEKIIPNIELINIVNEGLLLEVIENKEMTNKLAGYYCNHIKLAEDLKATAILNVCSTFGDAAKLARGLTEIPIFRIDEPMMNEAVRTGCNIGLIATLDTTLSPSNRLIEDIANKHNKKLAVNKYSCQDAWKAHKADNNKEKFETAIRDIVKKASKENDVIVLAQASMFQLKPLLLEIECPVLSSLPSGIEQIRINNG